MRRGQIQHRADALIGWIVFFHRVRVVTADQVNIVVRANDRTVPIAGGQQWNGAVGKGRVGWVNEFSRGGPAASQKHALVAEERGGVTPARVDEIELHR